MSNVIRAILVLLLLTLCALGAVSYYNAQQQILQAEWDRDAAQLERDMARIQLQRKCK